MSYIPFPALHIHANNQFLQVDIKAYIRNILLPVQYVDLLIQKVLEPLGTLLPKTHMLKRILRHFYSGASV
jgi:hypothetical protein